MDLKSFRQFTFNWFWMAFPYATIPKQNREEKITVEIFRNIAWTSSILPHCKVPDAFFFVQLHQSRVHLSPFWAVWKSSYPVEWQRSKHSKGLKPSVWEINVNSRRLIAVSFLLSCVFLVRLHRKGVKAVLHGETLSWNCNARQFHQTLHRVTPYPKPFTKFSSPCPWRRCAGKTDMAGGERQCALAVLLLLDMVDDEVEEPVVQKRSITWVDRTESN